MFSAIAWRICLAFLDGCKFLAGNRGPKIWYFAYGANVNPVTLNLRQIQVFESQPYLLKNYAFGFCHPSAWKGHGFADVIYCEGQEAFGILHLISCWDMWRMDLFEFVFPFNRHTKTYKEENGKKFYFYQGTETDDQIQPLQAYWDGIQKAYLNSGIKSEIYERALMNAKPLETLPIERREFTFYKPKKFIPNWVILKYERMTRWLILFVYPHKMVGVRKKK